jgi:hypothetical protein
MDHICKNVQNIDNNKCRLLDLEINRLYTFYNIKNNLIDSNLIKMNKHKY